ncbi:MAG: gliding motility-associated C-terminal domain-containing protein [bacterium]|nr:gliding motility-associated C-terminal domain-containing protein [bacterium]MDD6026504.1 gliding motility-associated C-terminal domain-containing protein [bacterium]
MIKPRINVLAAMLMAWIGVNAQVAFTGDESHKIFEEVPAKNTGLDMVYVLYDSQQNRMQYTAGSSNATVKWYKFGATGGAYAEEITSIERNGNVSVLKSVIPNSGYIIEENTNRKYVWVVNYADYRLRVNSIEAVNDGDCSSATLNVQGEGDAIVYYSINGARKVLDRKLKLIYNNLVWNETDMMWNSETQEEELQELKSTISLPAPYCNTTFTLTGDRFLEYWGEGISVTSDEYQTQAVTVTTRAEQEQKGADNQVGGGDETTLGGSAPAVITFSAYYTDAVATKEWQMSHDAEFEEIADRRNEDEITVTFEEAGTTFWRFVCSNATGECSAYSDVYQVNIGESMLKCPNAFSPGVTEGVNDEWKVSYKSIVKFKCWIFNTWGVQLCELNDPSQGWDGKYKGKIVKPGVYYYVIDAEGSEGKKYKLKGDINVVGLRKERNTESGEGEITE